MIPTAYFLTIEFIGGVNWRDLVLLADACKELQISKSISVQSEFISDPFPRKRTGIAKVGGAL